MWLSAQSLLGRLKTTWRTLLDQRMILPSSIWLHMLQSRVEKPSSVKIRQSWPIPIFLSQYQAPWKKRRFIVWTFSTWKIPSVSENLIAWCHHIYPKQVTIGAIECEKGTERSNGNVGSGCEWGTISVSFTNMWWNKMLKHALVLLKLKSGLM